MTGEVSAGSIVWWEVPEGGRRFRKVAEGSGRWPKVPEGGRRFRKVAEGSGRWPKVPEGGRRFRKVAEFPIGYGTEGCGQSQIENQRSEERRVGKESRSGWSAYH